MSDSAPGARARWSRSRMVLAAGAALVVLALVVVGVVVLTAPKDTVVVPRADTSYFVSDHDCSNSSAGTSPSQPWCDAGPVDGKRLEAGDRLLFACGGVWNEPADIGERPYLTLSGTGRPGHRITLGAYEPTTGRAADCTDRPHLVGGSGTSEIVVVENPDYWNIANLELSRGAVGLRVHFTSAGHRSVALKNVVVHDFKGIFRGDCATWPHAYTALGVLFDHTLKTLPVSADAVLRGITITGFEGYHNQGSIGLLGYGCALKTATSTNLYNSIELRDVYLHDDGGPAPACSDGLELISASDVQVVDSRFEGEGGCPTNSGTTGVILGEVKNVSFVNDIFSSTPRTGSPDQSGIDLEGHTRDVTIRGSYFADNAGAGLEILTISDLQNFHTGFVISDNLFANNSLHPLAGIGEDGHIWRAGKAPEPSGTIRDNLYSDEIPFIVGALPDVTVSGNVGGTRPTSSAGDWGRTPTDWTAESSADSVHWTALTPGKVAARGADGSSVSRFDLRTPACSACSVARVWTAPRAGTVSIRGIAQLLPGAAAATVRIRVGDRSALTRAVSGDTSTAVDEIPVTAGEQLRFSAVVPAGGGVSWAPAIAYIG